MFIGAAFSYGFDWGGDDININCCGDTNVGDINIGDGNRGDNIGNRGDRVEHHRGDRFNADRQRVNGKDKLTWNGNKARQKQTANRKRAARPSAGTLPARSNRAGANTKRTDAGTSKLKNPYVGDTKANRGNRSSLGNYQSSRESSKARDHGRQTMQRKNTRQSGGSQFQNRQRSGAGAFGGYGSGSRATSSSRRGSSSMRTSRGGRR